MYKLAYLDIWMVYTMSFKENFTRLCNQKGESPTTVCKKLGLSNAAYSCWTDESIPRKSTLIKIADYFGVTVDYLLGKETEKPAGVPDAMWAELCKDEKRKALALWIMSLPDDDLARAEKLLDAGKLFPPNHS